MRGPLGWFLVLACCGLFGYLQTRSNRNLRAGAEDQTAPTIAEREGTWRTLTVGRPSGAEPINLEGWFPIEEEPHEGLVPGNLEVQPAPVNDGQTPPPVQRPADFEYSVPRGRVLSKICEEFYGTGRAPVPQRVAEYNQLASPDAVRAGQKLLLPAWEILFPEGRERP